MIGLIVTGHGNFATGLTSSLKLIAGDPEKYVAVDFLPEYSVEDLERELNKAFDELKDCEGIKIFFTHAKQQVISCNTGIIDDHINMSISINDFFHHRFYFFAFGNITFDCFMMTAWIKLCQYVICTFFTVGIIDDHIIFF